MPQAATVGRVVWVWLSGDDSLHAELTIRDEAQAFKGEVLFVHPENGKVTVEVTDHVGNTACLITDPVRDPSEDDSHGAGETYAAWMPYQKAQHDKTAV